MLEGEEAAQAVAEASRKTTSRRDLQQNPNFESVSPEVGVLDEDAFDQLLDLEVIADPGVDDARHAARQVEVLGRQGGVFDRPCPHMRAAREAEAGARLARGDRRGAVATMRAVCADAPDEPGYALSLAAMLTAGDAAEAAQRW